MSPNFLLLVRFHSALFECGLFMLVRIIQGWFQLNVENVEQNAADQIFVAYWHLWPDKLFEIARTKPRIEEAAAKASASS